MAQNKFTAIEQKIYDIMMNSVALKQKETVSSIAEKAGAAPSSVIKLTKKLGYPGWNEMFYTLSKSHTDVISLSFNNFDFLTNDAMNQYIQTLCELLKQSREGRVYVCAIGNADFAAEYLVEKLWGRGFTVVPAKLELLSMNDQKGLPGMAIVINESGIVLLDYCLEARKNNHRVVTITGNSQSPLASHSDVTIELKNHKSSLMEYSPNFFTARVVIFIELLFVIYDEMIQ